MGVTDDEGGAGGPEAWWCLFLESVYKCLKNVANRFANKRTDQLFYENVKQKVRHLLFCSSSSAPQTERDTFFARGKDGKERQLAKAASLKFSFSGTSLPRNVELRYSSSSKLR